MLYAYVDIGVLSTDCHMLHILRTLTYIFFCCIGPGPPPGYISFKNNPLYMKATAPASFGWCPKMRTYYILQPKR